MSHHKILSFGGALVITLGAFFVAAQPAFAGPERVVVTGQASPDLVVRTISYADLNLVAPAGQRTLDRRVGSAIGDLCTEAVGTRHAGFHYNRSLLRCRSRAWGEARPQMSLAVERAQQIAMTGTSAIPPVAITLTLMR